MAVPAGASGGTVGMRGARLPIPAGIDAAQPPNCARCSPDIVLTPHHNIELALLVGAERVESIGDRVELRLDTPMSAFSADFQQNSFR
jgi:hypothetical protein